MKNRNGKIILVFSLLGVLVLGSLLVKSLGSESVKNSASSDFTESLVVTPDILVYTKSAAAIIVGEVKEVVDHPNNTGTPFTGSVLDAKIDIKEVLKGNPNMSNVSVLMVGNSENEWIEDSAILTPGEKVLLFLGTNGEGDYVVFAGEAGKGVIDENNNVTGSPAFTMPLDELKVKIQEALGG